ncbi:MAG: hypothetical protein C4527_22735 [Candidatus Omnitrophota bacterium]|nr:MAG: hypothetical protein C4527_22735 [Candidatus Omnitrophota bacterium]
MYPDPFSKDQITSWLEHYLNKDQNFFYQDYFARNSTLKEEGIDPIPFSMGLLSDVQYADFWEDAINLYTAAMYRSQNLPALADHLIEWLERKEIIYTSKIITFKVICLNSLLQLVGPNFFQDGMLKDKIVAFSDRFFQQGNVTDPRYWYSIYNLEAIASLPPESLSHEQNKIMIWTQTVARECVKFAGYLHYATTDKKYADIVKQSENSEFIQVRNKAITFLSVEKKDDWLSGNYELFAMYRQQRTLTPEEMETIGKSETYGSTRTNKDGTRPRN